MRWPAFLALTAVSACTSIDYPGGATAVPVTMRAVSWGRSHACLESDAGGLACWGSNDAGQVGTPGVAAVFGPHAPELGPLALRGPVSGDAQSCALDDGGAAWCWGTGSEMPRQAAGGRPFTELQGGAFFCGRGADAVVWCWDTLPGPAHAINGSASFLAFDVGSKGCAIQADSLVTCWGIEGVAAAIPGGIAFRYVSVGAGHACGMGSDGRARCWGENAFGQLGTNNVTPSDTPVLVFAPATGDTLVSISAGARNSCALGKAGRPYCWGWAGSGAVGIGYFAGIEGVSYKSPISVALAPAFDGIIASRDGSTCGVAVGRAVWCWGVNDRGQLGLEASDTAWTPVQVPMSLEVGP